MHFNGCMFDRSVSMYTFLFSFFKERNGHGGTISWTDFF